MHDGQRNRRHDIARDTKSNRIPTQQQRGIPPRRDQDRGQGRGGYRPADGYRSNAGHRLQGRSRRLRLRSVLMPAPSGLAEAVIGHKCVNIRISLDHWRSRHTHTQLRYHQGSCQCNNDMEPFTPFVRGLILDIHVVCQPQWP